MLRFVIVGSGALFMARACWWRRNLSLRSSRLADSLCWRDVGAQSGVTEAVVAEQLDAINLFVQPFVMRRGLRACLGDRYGKTASSAQAQAVHEFIRKRVAAQDGQIAAGLCILYGGSVKANNAAELFAMPDIDGGLIGGAALVAEEFLAICRAGVRT
jgi:triosephosphate isomerase